MGENNIDFASALEAINQIGSPSGSESEAAPVDMDDFASALEAIKQIDSATLDSEENVAPDFAINDFSKLKEYGVSLHEIGQSFSDIYQQLNEHTQQVCEGWGDDKNRRSFMMDLEYSQDQIRELAKKMQGYSSYIKQLCEAGEELHNICKTI